jgi:hypothetical protein
MSDKPSLLNDNPALDDALILRLTYDLATKIHTKPTIAHRYGFKSVGELVAYLAVHPQIVENVKKARALIQSDEGSEARIKLKALQATEELIPATAGIAADPRVAPQQRIDAFKQLSRVSGMDGSAAAVAAARNFGPAFTLNILFRDNPDSKLSFSTESTPASAGAGALLASAKPTPASAGAGAPKVTSDDIEDYEEDV